MSNTILEKQSVLGLFAIAVLLLSLVFSSSIVLSSGASNKSAIIVNTGNNFPNENDTDAFPGQALQAYWALRKNGYDDEQITLMLFHTNDPFVDFDGDGKNDLDNAVVDYEGSEITKETILAQIEKIGSIIEPYGELWIYLVDHGRLVAPNTAALQFENAEVLYETEFSNWINSLLCKKLVILADFCYSGEFIDSSIGPGRICISSCDEERGWYYWNWNLSGTVKELFGSSGSVFFHPFWNKIAQGASPEEAFDFANKHYRDWEKVDLRNKEIIELQTPKMVVKERSFFENIGYEILAFFYSLRKMMFGKIGVLQARRT
mgnify:CR=1 FL=1